MKKVKFSKINKQVSLIKFKKNENRKSNRVKNGGQRENAESDDGAYIGYLLYFWWVIDGEMAGL